MWWTAGGGGVVTAVTVQPKLNLHNDDNDNSFVQSVQYLYVCADSFLNRDVVSYMAVGIDLNYFIQLAVGIFIFAMARLPTRSVSKLNAIQPVHRRLPIDNEI